MIDHLVAATEVTSIETFKNNSMAKSESELRIEFIGAVVRHTKGGVVHCNAEPTIGKVDYGRHNCQEKMTAGDDVILYYEKEEGEEWLQLYRFCSNCDDARRLPQQGRKHGTEQAVVEGTLEHFEGTVEGKFYEDAVRLTDVQVHHYSPVTEG
ncbi:hypothetical protein OB919_20435 [Halobacteria archaeon AArc-curdl1]|uniref:Uncharacterized protein n=1 Tax=Natronosalvus hydrolyticus TaxID=2979988 RepID=A0AAP3E8V1_9EURY|nr:hypothetical protein [Halobacteria archaeon AArc-curdl1]